MGEFEGEPVLEHSGGIHGFASYLLRMPARKLVVAVLSNNAMGSAVPALLPSGISGHGNPPDQRKTFLSSPHVLILAGVSPQGFGSQVVQLACHTPPSISQFW